MREDVFRAWTTTFGTGIAEWLTPDDIQPGPIQNQICDHLKVPEERQQCHNFFTALLHQFSVGRPRDIVRAGGNAMAFVQGDVVTRLSFVAAVDPNSDRASEYAKLVRPLHDALETAKRLAGAGVLIPFVEGKLTGLWLYAYRNECQPVFVQVGPEDAPRFSDWVQGENLPATALYGVRPTADPTPSCDDLARDDLEKLLNGSLVETDDGVVGVLSCMVMHRGTPVRADATDWDAVVDLVRRCAQNDVVHVDARLDNIVVYEDRYVFIDVDDIVRIVDAKRRAHVAFFMMCSLWVDVYMHQLPAMPLPLVAAIADVSTDVVNEIAKVGGAMRSNNLSVNRMAVIHRIATAMNQGHAQIHTAAGVRDVPLTMSSFMEFRGASDDLESQMAALDVSDDASSRVVLGRRDLVAQLLRRLDATSSTRLLTSLRDTEIARDPCYKHWRAWARGGDCPTCEHECLQPLGGLQGEWCVHPLRALDGSMPTEAITRAANFFFVHSGDVQLRLERDRAAHVLTVHSHPTRYVRGVANTAHALEFARDLLEDFVRFGRVRFQGLKARMRDVFDDVVSRAALARTDRYLGRHAAIVLIDDRRYERA